MAEWKADQRARTFLKRWKGGCAEIVTYTASHSVLIVRITRPDKDGFLEFGCCACRSILAEELMWLDCDLRFVRNEGTEEPRVVVTDEKAGFSVYCGGVDASECAYRKGKAPRKGSDSKSSV